MVQLTIALDPCERGGDDKVQVSFGYIHEARSPRMVGVAANRARKAAGDHKPCRVCIVYQIGSRCSDKPKMMDIRQVFSKEIDRRKIGSKMENEDEDLVSSSLG